NEPYCHSSPAVIFLSVPTTTAHPPLSLHDALPIYHHRRHDQGDGVGCDGDGGRADPPDYHRPESGDPESAWPEDAGHRGAHRRQDRKSTRLNSSHEWISYAVFCLKKKIKDNRLYVR